MGSDTISSTGVAPCPKMAPILNYPGFIASDNGDIYNPSGRKLQQQPDGNGGMKVNIGTTTVGVHNLILPAFTGYPPKWWGYRPRHRSDDRSDNSLENLVWGKLKSTASTLGR